LFWTENSEACRTDLFAGTFPPPDARLCVIHLLLSWHVWYVLHFF